jgi:hypothetical protein
MQQFSLRNILEHPHRKNAISPNRESNLLAMSAMARA